MAEDLDSRLLIIESTCLGRFTADMEHLFGPEVKRHSRNQPAFTKLHELFSSKFKKNVKYIYTYSLKSIYKKN